MLSLAPNFGGHEFLKLPAFISHFIEHKMENKNITLMQFMHIHYMQGNIMDDDHDRDMSLPFKTEDVCIPAGVVAFLPVSIPEYSFKPHAVVLGKIPVTNDSFVSFQSLSNIWQPPKAA